MLLIDGGMDLASLAPALAPELSCRDHVQPAERDAVVAIVTGAVPVAEREVVDYPNLRIVLSCSVGTDHLDLDGLRRRGVTVCHTPGYCTEEVADHALACVLAGWRELWGLDRAVRSGAWTPDAVLRRFDAQLLGIVGLGRIGRALARKAAALGIEVIAHDPWAHAPPRIRMATLSDLLASSDAVSLHAPATRDGRPLLGPSEFALIKPGTVLVNLARASLVDHEAMLAALRDGRLAAAAVDVWPQEPPVDGDPRLQTPGLLITPHVAWSSPQADQEWRRQAVEVLRASLLRDEEPEGRVA